jgi:hypothetical protein
LEQIVLQKSDQVKMMYDYGVHNTLIVEVQEVKKNVSVLPSEVNPYGHDTRVKMVKSVQDVQAVRWQ